MADTKDITLYNKTKAVQVVYDASGQPHEIQPGTAVKLSIPAGASRHFENLTKSGDGLTTEVPKDVKVSDKTAPEAVSLEAAYRPRNDAQDIEKLKAQEAERQEKAADEGEGDSGKPQMVNAKPKK